jgi:putative hydrolase of the HAD superfamily
VTEQRRVELRGVLFDLDGTLADTASAERASWPSLAALIERHVPAVDAEELHERYQSVFERHWQDFLAGRIDFREYRRRRLREALAPWCELDDALFEAYRAEKRRGVERLRPFDDALAVLARLRAAGLRVGLLTNGPSELQRRKLEATGLAGAFDAIAISEEVGCAKPHPRAFEAALALLGCDAAGTAMVGDSPLYDVQGALAAGLATAVLVTGGAEFPLDGELDVDGVLVVDRLADVPVALGIV